MCVCVTHDMFMSGSVQTKFGNLCICNELLQFLTPMSAFALAVRSSALFINSTNTQLILACPVKKPLCILSWLHCVLGVFTGHKLHSNVYCTITCRAVFVLPTVQAV